MKTFLRLGLASVALVAANSALADATFNLSGGTYASNTYSVGGLQITGWADTGGSTSPGTVAQQVATGNDASAGMTYWSGNGLGMINGDACTSGTTCNATAGATDTYETYTGEHALDNNQRNEMVLVNFGSAVKLTSASINWNGTDDKDYAGAYQDSDMTILAYVGAVGGQAAALTGKSWAQIGAATNFTGNAANNTGKDWMLIGNYLNVGCSNNGANCATITSGGTATVASSVYSSFWLIGAFNSLGTSNGSGDATYDSLKLSGLTACYESGQGANNCTPPTNVPEPGSLALLGLGFAGMAVMRRRKTAVR